MKTLEYMGLLYAVHIHRRYLAELLYLSRPSKEQPLSRYQAIAQPSRSKTY